MPTVTVNAQAGRLTILADDGVSGQEFALTDLIFPNGITLEERQFLAVRVAANFLGATRWADLLSVDPASIASVIATVRAALAPIANPVSASAQTSDAGPGKAGK